jgi:cardiolipin synthase
VRLLLPGKSDHALVLYAGRSFIDDLLRAGVRVFELSGAMPHGKGVVIDSHFASVGSANMDQRSFRLNFEGNMFFYNEDVANQLKAGFLELCAQAEEITLEKRKQLGVIRHLAESAANIMSPLL